MQTAEDSAALHKAVHKVLKSFSGKGKPPLTLLDNFLLVKQYEPVSPGDHAASVVVVAALNILAQQDPAAAKLLRWRFLDNETLTKVATRLRISEDSISRQQRLAIVELTDLIQNQEAALRQAQQEQLEAHLPPPTYSQLFGLEELYPELEGCLLKDEEPDLVILIGIGGIGKTALADAICRRIIPYFHFDGVYWLRLEPPTMSGEALSHEHLYDQLLSILAERLGIKPLPVTSEDRLTQVLVQLKAKPYLIVIDNLESTTTTDFLFSQLSRLAGPSKFLLTSRAFPKGQTAVRRIVMPELSQENSAALMEYHAAQLGVSALTEVAGESLAQIYSVTGGNPLALKLVVSLLDLLPLPQILKDLASSRSGPIESLYHHIYWQSWQTLSERAKSLLQAMPLVADAGGTPEYLQAISGLEEDAFWEALRELHSRSLLEVRGSLEAKRYGIHRLTETFVRTDIVGWPEGGEGP